jgi:pantoate--beta-alanine ligase
MADGANAEDKRKTTRLRLDLPIQARIGEGEHMDLEIVAVPTVREPDGLAMSSRNTHLSTRERKSALVLWEALCLARGLWEKGERSAERLRQEMTSLIESAPLARIDYVSVADPDTLEELDKVDRPALVSLAVTIGKTRLIDNITLGE